LIFIEVKNKILLNYLDKLCKLLIIDKIKKLAVFSFWQIKKISMNNGAI